MRAPRESLQLQIDHEEKNTLHSFVVKDEPKLTLNFPVKYSATNTL